MTDKITRNIEQYEASYMADYGFESVMVACRRKLLLERLRVIRPKVVVEIGCGSEPLYEHFLAQADPIDCWLIVEPGQSFQQAVTDRNLPNCKAILGLFEDMQGAIMEQLDDTPDFIICSALLHEVPRADELLTAISRIMDKHTLLHVNVPNAASFHRRLAKTAGLISDLRAMSERNRQLLQHRVYDIDSLTADHLDAGLWVESSGGYFIKPFTHLQMEFIAPKLGENVMDGLYELGKEFPELASEIYIESRLACI